MMKQIICGWLLLAAIGCLLVSCAGSGSPRVYRSYHGHGPWFGHRAYYRDRVVVVPPGIGGGPVAEQLPDLPPDMPDMGMPDMDVGIDAFD